MEEDILKPTPEVAVRVEELLREQLFERGIKIIELAPEKIKKSMECHIAPDQSMTYFWDNEALLHVVPEKQDDAVLWRMFTKDDL